MPDKDEEKKEQTPAPARTHTRGGVASLEEKLLMLQEQVDILLDLHLRQGSHTDELERLRTLKKEVLRHE